MTEKEIIDITQCKFNTFDGGNTQRTICTLDNCFCDSLRDSDCYYKQLKRKEEQLKRYENEYEGFAVKYTDMEIALKRKMEECDKLKKEIDITNCANIELSLELKKYQNAIDKIDEIADNNCEISEMEQILMIIGGLDE